MEESVAVLLTDLKVNVAFNSIINTEVFKTLP